MSIDEIAKKLEGKYFAFNFWADYTEDDRTGLNIDLLVICRVKKGKLQKVYDSYENNDVEKYAKKAPKNGTINNVALEYLKANSVREVYCLFDEESRKKLPEEFLGFSLQWHHDENEWGAYNQLSRRIWGDFFRQAGIKLKFLDEQKWYIEYAENLTTPK